MLGVSRTSVRDALKQLTDRGYLEVRRGRNGGYFVLVDWGPDSAHHVRRQLVAHWSEFEHIFDARRLVEPMIARTAAVRRTKGDIAVMQAAVQAYIDAADRDSAACRHGVAPCCRGGNAQSGPGGHVPRPTRQDHAEPRRRTLHRRSAPHGHRPTHRAGRSGGRWARRRAAIAARHFAMSEALMRKLVDRAEHDDGARSAMMSGQLVICRAAPAADDPHALRHECRRFPDHPAGAG